MNDFNSLKCLDRFQFLFKRVGIDYDAMRNILQLKLTMDQRRVPAIFSMNSSKKKQGNQFLKSLWYYVLYGLITVPFLFLGGHYMLQMSLLFGITMFFLMTSMISDFTSVLLDVRDKNIIGTKPVNKKTINAAKMVHVGIYMALSAGAFIAAPLIVMILTKGIVFSLLFLGMLILSLIFIIALTALIYIGTLHVFSGEKLKDIINYVQILLSVGIIVGYQLLARSFEMIDFAVSYTFSWWHVMIPPIWFGAPFEWLLGQHNAGGIVFLALLALVVPIISIIIYARLMPSFERNLEKLLNESGTSKRPLFDVDHLWSRLVCFSHEERVFFQFAAAMMKKEREFKLKVYPTLGMALFFPFVFLFNSLNDLQSGDIGDGKAYLTIYISSIMIPAAVHMLNYSENYNGSWIFRTIPLADSTSMHRGAIKAFIVKLYLPIFAVLSVVFLFIFSSRIIPDLIAVFLAGYLETVVSYKILNGLTFPFSQSFELAHDTNTGFNILLSLMAAVFAIVHYSMLSVNYGIYIYIGALMIGSVVSWLTIFRNHNQTQPNQAS
ncbi:hypothetical protein GCM10007063_33960 [Lentibacillus kapialis]|uniref:Uncharacterized protein n=1 Tax=Lentibacillus kapialis TaxID=340214 RepID=A0A917V1H4_9BACI|nr:hypothetical protein [Lentibacillus kapialis]GGK08745.1 hypothetical protein GCM10007063_33960 [Lentibacillus kapialis]